MCLISEINIVDRDIFEDDLFPVSFHRISLQVHGSWFQKADIRENADDADNKQGQENKDTDGICHTQDIQCPKIIRYTRGYRDESKYDGDISEFDISADKIFIFVGDVPGIVF